MRVWEFEDNKAIPSDLVREQDFILRLRRLQRLGTPHLVVNLVLSAVEAIAKSRRAIEAVHERLQEFAKVTNGTYCEMSNGDAFLVWEETADAQLLAMRVLNAVMPDGAARDPEKFLLTFHMPRDYVPLRERSNHYIEVVRAAATFGSAGPPADALKSAAASGPLTAWSVDQIEKLLGDIDLRRYGRSQNVYKHVADGNWMPLLEEYFISFADLRRERFPKLEIIAPEHLFLALCETLDQKLLALLTEQYETIAGRPVNLNLSVASIMGSVFAQFARRVPKNQHHLIGFELHRGDLLQDFAQTLNAVDVLHREGFKVALDSITPDMVDYVDLGRFNADFVKINVSKDRVEQLASPAARQGLAKIPNQKLVFFRCDNEKALTVGREIGVELFQGWLIDDTAQKKPGP